MRLTIALTAALLALAVNARAEDDTALWKSKCASCHGMDGKAQTEMGKKHKVPDMSTAAWHADAKHTEAWVRDIVENGVKDSKMKPFKEKLSAEEINAMIAYNRALKPK